MPAHGSQLRDWSNKIPGLIYCRCVGFGVPRAFEKFFEARRQEKGWTKTEVAKRFQPAKEITSSVSYLSKVIHGKIRPPKDEIEQLADALWLEGEDRKLFKKLALLAQGPEELEVAFLELERRVHELRQRKP